MFLLYAVHYPDRRLSRRQVEDAWTGAGLPQPVPVFSSDGVGPEDIRALVEAKLKQAGAAASDAHDGDLEVPDATEPLLTKLEEFYQRLYPETRTAASRHAFFYERPEMLGEF